ncbi:hypothetical protein [Actinophytocola sp.]|uniref:hypothetical protein n=1 Tax=Actinophytocola sp. TaxID=1872138 RepID=UPI002ED354FD
MTHPREARHRLDEFAVDHGTLTPACDEPEFAALLETMVADEAPRLFAVIQEYGERVDAVIAAWGVAFDDHAEIVAHRLRMSVREPANALRMFHVGNHVRARLVWFNPAGDPRRSRVTPMDCVNPVDTTP